MNEIILFLIVAVLLLISQFALKKISPKPQLIIRLFAAIIMVLLLWGFSADTKIAPRVLISVLIVSYSIGHIMKYNKRQSF